VGENKNRKVDVRVVASTNRDLSQRVAAGAFRPGPLLPIERSSIACAAIARTTRRYLASGANSAGRGSNADEATMAGFTRKRWTNYWRYACTGTCASLRTPWNAAVALARGDRVDSRTCPRKFARPFHSPWRCGQVRPLGEVEKEYIVAALACNEAIRPRTAVQFSHRRGDGLVPQAQELRSYRG